MSTDSQPNNPKDAAAVARVPLHLVPASLPVYAALAFAEGDLKYGGHNWRVAGVRASVYVAALERHLKRYWSGEWADQKTGVPHLASVIACAGIILDARLADKLTDDRPPAVDLSSLIDEAEAVVAHLQEIFADRTPGRWTIGDEVPNISS